MLRQFRPCLKNNCRQLGVFAPPEIGRFLAVVLMLVLCKSLSGKPFMSFWLVDS